MSLAGEAPSALGPVGRLAAATGMTEGQTYTLAIGLVLALTTAAIGIPPTLRDGIAPLGRLGGLTAPPATTDDAGADPGPADPAPIAAPPFVPSVDDRPAGASSFTVEPDPAFDEWVGDDGPAYADGGQLGHVEVVATAEGGPHGIAVDPATGGFFVATAGAGVVAFDATGGRERTYDVDGELTGVLLEGDRLVVLDGPGAEVLELDTTSGAVRTLATVTATLPTTAPMLHGVVRAPNGNLLVSDAGQGVLWQVDAGGAVTEWYRGPELLSADGAGPAGLAIDADGNVLVAISRSAVALTGAVHRIPWEPDGSAGISEPLHRSLPDTELAGLAVGATGRIYVAATGADHLVVLGADGAEIEQITADALVGPVGMAFRGESLLVTATSGTISRAAVEDEAAR